MNNSNRIVVTLLSRLGFYEPCRRRYQGALCIANMPKVCGLSSKKDFSHTNIVQLFHIENVVRDCQQGSSSVTAFFTKLKGLWDEKDSLCVFLSCICEAAPEIKSYMETQKAMQFPMGLNESFGNVQSNMMGLDPLPAINKAYTMALCHEKQIEAASGKATDMWSFYIPCEFNQVPNSKERERRCEICNYNNHNTKKCRALIKCTYCNGQGHSQETCRRKRNASINLASSSNEDMSNFPFSKNECNQMLGLLNKMKNTGGTQADQSQLLEMLHTVKQSSVNMIDKTPNYEELSSKARKLSHNTKWIYIVGLVST